MTLSELLPVFLIGALGSIHCVGMCGGFAMAIAQTANNRRSFLLRQTFYYLGKTTTYMLLGALLGGLGAMIGSQFKEMQQVLSIVLGLILIAIGAGLLGWTKPISTPLNLARWKGFTATIGKLIKRKSKAASFGLGLLNGLLPCGLVYGALALAAASGTMLTGALQMGVFGLATIPALFALASAGILMKPLWRSRLNQVSGGVVIALGIITIVRIFPMSHMMH